MNESCHTYEWVMSHIRMRLDTHMNASRHANELVVFRVWTSYHTHGRVMSHVIQKEPYKRDDILQKRPFFLRSLLVVSSQYDAFIRVTWLIHKCDMTPWTSYHTHGRVMSHITRDSRSHVQGVMSHLWMRHVTRINASCWLDTTKRSL